MNGDSREGMKNYCYYTELNPILLGTIDKKWQRKPRNNNKFPVLCNIISKICFFFDDEEESQHGKLEKTFPNVCVAYKSSFSRADRQLCLGEEHRWRIDLELTPDKVTHVRLPSGLPLAESTKRQTKAGNTNRNFLHEGSATRIGTQLLQFICERSPRDWCVIPFLCLLDGLIRNLSYNGELIWESLRAPSFLLRFVYFMRSMGGCGAVNGYVRFPHGSMLPECEEKQRSADKGYWQRCKWKRARCCGRDESIAGRSRQSEEGELKPNGIIQFKGWLSVKVDMRVICMECKYGDAPR